MATVNHKYIDESIATATTSASILQARQVRQKSGGALYALVHVSGTWTGSISVEVSPPDRNAWVAALTITANSAQSLLVPADADYRFNLTSLLTGGPVAVFMALPA